jgi:hypothetical protein
VLGNRDAPITITEYGDLLSPVCADFAETSLPEIIALLVRSGQAKLAYRGFEAASRASNDDGGHVISRVAARSAGLQNKEWNDVLLAYAEQSQAINGRPALNMPSITSTYFANLARQIKGHNLARWQAHPTDNVLVRAVAADGNAATRAGAVETPSVFVTGPRGTIEDRQTIPTVATIESLASRLK